MKLVSIDVGIKNLAFCLLELEDNTNNVIKIIKWDVINLSQQTEIKCCVMDKNIPCNKPAKFTKNSNWYCLKHSKKQDFQIPNSQLKPSFINKQKIQSLYEIADKYKIKYTSPIKKGELISIINDYIYNTCFEVVENKNAGKIDLVTIGRNIQYKFDDLLEQYISSIDKVIIENQIGPIANRMKTIQGMIAQYFIIRNNNIQLEFVNATNKLKQNGNQKEKQAKMTYSERKKESIIRCLDYITNNEKYREWESFFKNHKKNDDLADSFLQSLWYIENKN
jgi:hypothetical protein